ncbi:hypothetical protein [Methanosarcina mazei]|nr:hypothetical protein [Methanosarcina mazei]
MIKMENTLYNNYAPKVYKLIETPKESTHTEKSNTYQKDSKHLIAVRALYTKNVANSRIVKIKSRVGCIRAAQIEPVRVQESFIDFREARIVTNADRAVSKMFRVRC